MSDTFTKSRKELLKDPNRTNASIAAIVKCHKTQVGLLRRAMETVGEIAKFRGRGPSSDSPSYKKTASELCKDPNRPNSAIGAVCGVGSGFVCKVRHVLEQAGQITKFRGRPHSSRPSRAPAELLSNPNRSNPVIAKVLGLSIAVVRKHRLRLEQQGKIPKFRAAHIGTPKVEVQEAVKAELLSNPNRTSREIAEAAGAGTTMVHKYRHELEQQGKIPKFRAARGWDAQARSKGRRHSALSIPEVRIAASKPRTGHTHGDCDSCRKCASLKRQIEFLQSEITRLIEGDKR